MRVTKEAAKHVAGRLTEIKLSEEKKARKELSELAYSIAQDCVPKDVQEFYQKHKSFFHTTTRLQVSGTGLNYEELSFSPELPSRNEWRFSKLVTNKQAEQIVKLLNLKKKKEKERKELFVEIENAVLALGTYAKVEVEFKEAFAFLPKKLNQQLVVNINSIREKL